MNVSAKLTRRSTPSPDHARACSREKGSMARLRRLGVAAALALLVVPLASGCNDHPVGNGEGPEFRGITVPLPPPSFRSATLVDVELSGRASSFEGGRATVWNTEDPHGLTAQIDAAGAFKFRPWKLRVDKHCVELRAARDYQAPSTPRFYAMDLFSGPACTAGTCSAVDSVGDCLCLVRYAGNCINRREAAAPGTSPATDASSGSGSTD